MRDAEPFGESIWLHITAIALGVFVLGVTIGAIVLNEANLYEGLRHWQAFIASVIAIFAGYFLWRANNARVGAVERRLREEQAAGPPEGGDHQASRLHKLDQLKSMAEERRSALTALLAEISDKKSFSLEVLRETRQTPLEFLPGAAPQMSLRTQSALLAASRSLDTYSQLLENLTVTRTGPDGKRVPSNQDDINRVGPLASRCTELLDNFLEHLRAELAEKSPETSPVPVPVPVPFPGPSGLGPEGKSRQG